MLSIIIPTLNAAATLQRVVLSLRTTYSDDEIIVVDGGSTDGTQAVAESLGVGMISAPRGRGRQLSAGAEIAGGEWLLFLHGDTVLDAGWRRAADYFMADPGNRERAAVFKFALDDPSPAARRLEAMVELRCRLFALPYGDQGLLLGRSFYRRLGGYPAINLYEDVDMVRRIGRRRLVRLNATATTSASRYRRHGYLLRPLRNLTCLSLYLAGVAPKYIGRLYN